MIEQTNSQKLIRRNPHSDQKETKKFIIRKQVSQIRANDEMNEQKDKAYFDDSAELFRGLITGDEHYHTRSSAFIPFWG